MLPTNFTPIRMENFKHTLIQFTQNGMGSGNSELAHTLAYNYLNLLLEEEELPRFICLYNEGVKLLCDGASTIQPFKDLQEKGVKIIACKTCLNYYNLTEKVEVGIQGTMIDIIQIQKIADKVISL